VLPRIRETLVPRLCRVAVTTASILASYLGLQPTAVAAGSLLAPSPANRMHVALTVAAAPVDFPAIVERYGPAVVNISAVAPDQQTAAANPARLDPDDPFFVFFRHSVPDMQDLQGSPPRVRWGAGSGFIISPEGLIVTTAHVVNHADEVTVRLTDRREFRASVLAVDADSDAALIKIDATKLTALKLGDSSRVRLSEQVLAVGSPFGFENAVSGGIVSATPHALTDGSNFPFLQTTVAVNPDNSGGPVFNGAGEVIGIDVQIYLDTERYQSLTFAIPINVVAKLRMQSEGKVAHGALGITVQDVDPGLARAFGLPRPAGALVDAVAPDSPAAAGGLKPGDVIVRIGDKATDRAHDLLDYIAGLPPGTNVALALFRNRRAVMLTVKVVASARSAGTAQDDASAADRLGLAVRPLSEGERQANALAAGLMVDAVFGPAANAGIQPGDIVVALDDTPVSSREQLATLAAQGGNDVALLILRDNIRSIVSVRLR
jgi:serine protease Do